MKVVYDAATQSMIDFVQNRMGEIELDVMSNLNAATSISLYEAEKRRNPGYHPLLDNPEYQCLQERLAKIYELSVPRYLLTMDEYEKLMGGD